MKGCQYNEWSILERIFPALVPPPPNPSGIYYAMPGYVVEIGAADGVDNSNSYELIQAHNWYGLLVDPHPGNFMDLLKLYTTNPRVKLSHYAVSDKECRKMFGLDGQCSSLVYKKQFEIQVQCVTLTNLLKLYAVPHEFDFLSVDCEGEDMVVLRSLDWTVYKPKAVCVEHSMSRLELGAYMDLVGYKEFDHNIGNTFFVRK